MQDTAYVMAALGVASAFVIVSFSILSTRNARFRGLPIGLAVALGAPVLAIAATFVVSAVAGVPGETRARGGGFFRRGADGVLHLGAILLGVIVVGGLAAGLTFVARNMLGVSGEPLQTPIVRALIVGGLASGVGMSLWSRRIAFLESLFVTSILAVVVALPVVPAREFFTYGTAPAYFAVILLAGGGILLLSLVLGGSIGFLLTGDGEVSAGFGYESWIGRRFLMGKRGDSVVGTITVISVLAVAVGTCAMVVVMSVMNGFSTDLRQKIFGANAHLLVLKYGTDFTEYADVANKTRSVPGVIGASPFILNEVMVSSDTNLTGALLKGIETATIDSVTDLRANITKGDITWVDTPEKIPAPVKLPDPAGDPPPAGAAAPTPPPDQGAAAHKSEADQLDAALAAATKGVLPDPATAILPGVIIGAEMSKNLRIFLGDTINIVSPVGELGPSGPIPKARAFRVAAIFYSGMYEYDSKFIYISLSQSQDFFGLKGAVTGVEYKVDDIEETQRIATSMMKTLGGYPYRTKDWMEMNRNLFSALKLEKIAMFVILNVITIVASFLIAATLIVFVIEKSKEIAILKTLGATDTSIMKTFVTYGLVVGAVGTAVGIACGLIVCWLIDTFGIGLDPDVYYITHLPVHIDGAEVVLVSIAAVLLSYLATIYPALLAARLKPVDGLRYE
ncbi:MAG: FtsX-like permease family protein [Deltaproteobacteria bacterium]|nr:FtsX-like permease family protein [Deltaproteobacteria bacterium]